MAVSYAQVLSTDMIVAEIEALLDWQGDILRQCFFPGAPLSQPVDASAPSALILWCKREAERNTIDHAVVERLMNVYNDLCAVAKKIQDHAATQQPMTLELFDSFHNQCDAFINHIRRLQQDLADSSTAVDPVTGLRTVSGMRNDIKREQDRFDRKGTSFSIANIEIDDLDNLQKKYDRRGLDLIYASVAQVIARTVRSFDDAYYLGKGEYILVLKHVEFMDACSVMDRLRGEIENNPIFMQTGEKLKITASFGIAEAVQREKPDVCIGYAKTALEEAQKAGGNRISEYRELSALAQYARDMGKEGGV